MKIKCQQHNILKIKDKIPGHGTQEARLLARYPGRVFLACGCNLPISWLPKHERERIKYEHIPTH